MEFPMFVYMNWLTHFFRMDIMGDWPDYQFKRKSSRMGYIHLGDECMGEGEASLDEL